LLYNPKCMGISRHIEMQDLPPVVADDEKAVQNSKRERWDGAQYLQVPRTHLHALCTLCKYTF
jgi:hypothetical protein